MSHSDDTVYENLRELIAIRSVFPHEQEFEDLSKLMVDLGYSVEKIKTALNRENIVATYGKSTKFIGFYGHMDTVEPDKHYSRDPFTVWREDDRARGLGVADMKGGEGAYDLVDSEMLSDVSFIISVRVTGKRAH